MGPNDLVKLCEVLNPHSRPGRLTVITRMGEDNLRVRLPYLIRAIGQAGLIVTWGDPMHGNGFKAPCGLRTLLFYAIRVWFVPWIGVLVSLLLFALIQWNLPGLLNSYTYGHCRAVWVASFLWNSWARGELPWKSTFGDDWTEGYWVYWWIEGSGPSTTCARDITPSMTRGWMLPNL